MPRTARVALLVLAIASAFTVGRRFPTVEPTRRPALDPAGQDYQAPVRVTHWGGGEVPPQITSPECHELIPVRIVLDGERVLTTHRHGDLWQIDLADRRLTIYAVRSPAP